ncbi:MAG: ABC transporter ATP-binding protein [Candidatus Nanopelagicales bacterium]
MSAGVHFDGVSLTYPGAERPALDGLDLQVEEGELLVLVGPSGCGKSTSLRVLAGLEPATSGRLWIGERDVTELPAKDRDIAMVFQNYALYPHMTVAENLSFALRIQRTGKSEIQERVASTAKLLGISEYLSRKPRSLSGGQRQRVAMGRAIIREPKVFLMDEPLSNLDARLRVQTRSQIASLQRRLGTTTIYVTHDQVEAMTMGHRVAILNDGVLQQVDTPREVYDNPVNAFVATFIGSPSMNLLPARLVDGRAFAGAHEFEVPRAASTSAAVLIGIRPEHLEPASTGITLTVSLVEELGADTYVYGTYADGDGAQVEVTARVSNPPAPGSPLTLRPTRYQVFESTGGQRRVS